MSFINNPSVIRPTDPDPVGISDLVYKRKLREVDEQTSSVATGFFSKFCNDLEETEDFKHKRRLTHGEDQDLDPNKQLGLYLKNNFLCKAIRYAHQNGLICYRDPRGNTLLHLAVNEGRMKAVKLCLDAAIEIDAYNLEGQTALIEAVFNDDIEIAKVLCQAGANKDLGSLQNPLRAPAVMAYYHKNYEMMEAIPLSKEQDKTLARQELNFAFNFDNEAFDFPPSALWAFAHIANVSVNPEIKNAFTKAMNSERDIIEELKNEEIVIFELGILDHTIIMVIMKVLGVDALAICNRGFRKGERAIQWFPIDRSLIDQEIIDALSNESMHKSIDNPGLIEEIYETIPSKLVVNPSPIFDDLEILSELRDLKSQKKDNCTLASAKAAVAAIIAAQVYNQGSTSLTFERMQDFAKARYKKELSFPFRERIKEKAERLGVILSESEKGLIFQRLEKYRKYKESL